MRLTPVPRGRDVPWGETGREKKKKGTKRRRKVLRPGVLFFCRSHFSPSLFFLFLCARLPYRRQRQKLRKVDPIPLHSLWRGGPTSVDCRGHIKVGWRSMTQGTLHNDPTPRRNHGTEAKKKESCVQKTCCTYSTYVSVLNVSRRDFLKGLAQIRSKLSIPLGWKERERSFQKNSKSVYFPVVQHAFIGLFWSSDVKRMRTTHPAKTWCTYSWAAIWVTFSDTGDWERAGG